MHFWSVGFIWQERVEDDEEGRDIQQTVVRGCDLTQNVYAV